MKRFFVLTCLYLCCLLSTRAQQKITDPGLVSLLSWQDSLQKRLPLEKLYVQTDKSFYAVGDTIWLKAYLFKADYMRYSNLSGLLYVELVNDSATIVKRMMLPLKYGMGIGNINADGVAVAEGSYTLRAYTNWMRNFDESTYFTKKLYVAATNNQPVLITVKTGATVTGDKENLQASLLFKGIDQKLLALKAMQVRLQAGKKTLLNEKTTTDFKGTINITTPLTANADLRNLTLQADNGLKGEDKKVINIPVVLNRPQNTDVQFMPEGGNFVAGLPNRMGFKATGEDGYGVNIIGKVYNSKQEDIAAFAALHKGMGLFDITPQPNEHYTAKVTLPGGSVKTLALPPVKTSGTVLIIQNPLNDDDPIIVTIGATADLKASKFYLIGKAREIICFAQTAGFDQSATKSFTIPKNQFPTGIARFSLLNARGQALNERVIFINHKDDLKMALQADKKTYAPREQVNLQLQVNDKTGKPVVGSFSVAVTDDDQAPVDSITAAGMVTRLMLTTDLKGNVEEPGYYLKDKPQNLQALDNLLLTQGWVGYAWQQVTGPPEPPKFDAEPWFSIKGKVTNLFNNPVPGSTVILLLKGGDIPVQGKTNDKGIFEFDNVFITDTSKYYLQGSNKNGKDRGVAISVEQLPPPAIEQPSTRYLPWFVNTDTAILKAAAFAVNRKLQEDKLSGNVLKEVEIHQKKTVKNSKNLNGPGEADQVIDEKDIQKVNYNNLTELLEMRVFGLKLEAFNVNGKFLRESYMLGQKEVHFVIDGIDLDKFYQTTPGDQPPYDRYGFLRSYLDNYPAKEIAGIEVMYTGGYANSYNLQNLPAGAFSAGGQFADPAVAYIEITTLRGTGPFRKTSAGTFVYTPVQLNVAKRFYSPVYQVSNKGSGIDLRSTIYWGPGVVTDKDGKATISFYASDHPQNYTVIIEGSDMNGNIGGLVQKISSVKSPQ